MPATEKCVAISQQTGVRCGNWPIQGGSVCRFHGGAAPQVKEAARLRILSVAEKAADAIIEMINDPNLDPRVRLAAAKDMLDRGGLVAKQEVQVEVRRFEQLLDAGELIVDTTPDADGVYHVVGEQDSTDPDADLKELL